MDQRIFSAVRPPLLNYLAALTISLRFSLEYAADSAGVISQRTGTIIRSRAATVLLVAELRPLSHMPRPQREDCAPTLRHHAPLVSSQSPETVVSIYLSSSSGDWQNSAKRIKARDRRANGAAIRGAEGRIELFKMLNHALKS